MYNHKRVAVVIPAAGHGKRMKSDVSKQYIEILGKPILAITIEVFQNADIIDDIILVVGDTERGYVEKYIQQQYQFTKIRNIVIGGRERQDSVYAGLKSLDSSVEIVLIHDAVRPFIRVSEIEKMVCGAKQHLACVLGVRVKDTIKVINEEMNVVNTPERGKLFAIQTPQAFQRELIVHAYKKGIESGFNATDDAMMVEKFTNTTVKLIEGNESNIKITTQEDLNIAREILKMHENTSRI